MAEQSNLSAVAKTVKEMVAANGISEIFNKFVLALFILAGGFFIGRFIGKLFSKLMKDIELDAFAKKITKKNIPLKDVISFLISGVVYLASIILSLRQMGIAEHLFKWLAIVFIVMILISAALSIRDSIPNIVSGFRIIGRKQMRAGDHIKVDNIEGDIIKIDLSEIRLKTEKGDIVYIPNSIIAKSKVEVRKKL
jgi:small-conductance mechanosensitive channel